MGTTAEKLTYLNTTKGKIKDSINLTGAGITTEPFRQYAVKLKDAYVDIINNGTETLYNNFPKVSGSGTDLSLQNTYEAPMQSTLKGNTSKVQLSGKNKININGIYSTSSTSNLQRSYENGIATLTWTSGFSLYMAQDNSESNFIPLPDSTKTYTISFKHKGNALYLRFDESDTNIISTNVDSNYTTYSYTFNNLSEIKIKFIRKDTTGTAYLTDFQVEEGSTATTYEAYCGGTPSPNSSYPQDIHNVSGNNNIVVCGKNLFDKDNATTLSAILSTYNHKIETSANGKTTYINCLPNTTYTISKVADVRFQVATTSEIPAISVPYNDDYIANDTGNKITITTSANAKYLVIYYWHNSSTRTEQAVLDTLQVEKGNITNPTYEAYNGTTYNINLPNGMELSKIGTYQDYIYKENDKWYLHKEIGKVVLDGSETIGNPTILTNNARFGITNVLENGGSTTGLSNYFIYNASYSSDTEHTYTTSTGVYIFISKNTANTKEQLQTWLSTHNTIVNYVLETPTNTEITDTTLIEQLEAIYNAKSKNGTTNINQVNNDLGFIITASALEKEV